ncbi:MAG: YdjY domain-containing protein [Planctomycetes bacterium]|nr:YdjY domain-containing protein [Planctomycetota bacterium]
MRKDLLFGMVFIAIALVSITIMVVAIININSDDFTKVEDVQKHENPNKYANNDSESNGEHNHQHDNNTERTPPDFIPLCPPLNDDEKDRLKELYIQAVQADAVQESAILDKIELFGARAVPYLTELLVFETNEEIKLKFGTLIEILKSIPVKSENLLLLPGMEINTTRKYFRIEAAVSKIRENDEIQLVLTNNPEKSPQSLFMTNISGRTLNKAFLTIGAVPSTIRPEFAGDFRVYDGSLFKITIEYNKLGVRDEKIYHNLSSVIFDKVTERWLPITYWAFLGATKSLNAENTPSADETGNIFSLYNEDSSAILTNPWFSSTFKNRFQGFLDKLPEAGKPVYLKFEILPDSELRAQNTNVLEEYRNFDVKRDEIKKSNLPFKSQELLSETFEQSVNLTSALKHETEKANKMLQKTHLPALLPTMDAKATEKLKMLLDEFYKVEDTDLHRVVDEIKKFDCRYYEIVAQNANENYADDRSQILVEAAYVVADHAFQVGKIVYYHGIAIDLENKMIIADAYIPEVKNMPLEYIISGTNGKTYESLLVINALPYHLEVALERLGYQKSSNKPRQRGDWLLYDGDAAIIEVAWFNEEIKDGKLKATDYEGWKKHEKVSIYRVENLIKDLQTREAMPKTAFPFVGSKSKHSEKYMAQEYGTVCGALSDVTTLLENPWDGAMIPHVYRIMGSLIPATNSSVRLFFSMEPKTEREERMKILTKLWEKERLFRPFYHFDKLPGWELARETGSIVRYMKGDDRLVILISQNSSKKFEITDDDIENWDNEAEENSGFGRWIIREKTNFKNCEAYFRIIEELKINDSDKDNYIFIHYVRTLMFDYMIQFNLYNADLALCKATFKNIIEERLTLGLPEHYPEENNQTKPK